MDVRIHPAVRPLTYDYLKEVKPKKNEFKKKLVILSPFGLAGVLTGQYYQATDPIAKKTLEEWSIFYPFSKKKKPSTSILPPVVEVASGKPQTLYLFSLDRKL